MQGQWSTELTQTSTQPSGLPLLCQFMCVGCSVGSLEPREANRTGIIVLTSFPS